MATRIVFTAARGEGPLVIRVDGSPADILADWEAAEDQPFALHKESGDQVYVNPKAVAYWEEAPERRTGG
jgi:hypothetical protein